VTGSAADALRNVPSVEVDPQGEVSLRGDPNVVIMIDGKPSAMFKGAGRAAALQALPADQIDRVEVITNPSAAFSPEGSAGIINLVTKTAHKPGASGSLRANLGDGKRFNTGVSAAFNDKKFSLSADASVRRDLAGFDADDVRQTLSSDAPTITSFDHLHLNGRTDIWTARVGGDYDLDDKTRVSAQLRHNDVDLQQTGYERLASFDALGQPGLAYERALATSHFTLDDTEASASFRRKFAGEDHELTADLRRQWIGNDFSRPDRLSSQVPPRPDLFGLSRNTQGQMATGLKLNYQRPLPGAAKLKLGYELQIDRDAFANLRAEGPAPDALARLPGFADAFLHRQTINGAYATYERPIGDLTALAGLRLEEVLIRLDQRTLLTQDKIEYLRAYPSLHLAYRLSDTEKLTASYSRRVQRPPAYALNPLPQYGDPLTLYSGNPRLKPEMTDALEAGYERKRGGAYYQATLFYRETHDAVVNVVLPLPGGVLLNTKQNAGRYRNAGLELTANGRFTKTLNYQLSGGARWAEISADNLGALPARSVVTATARASLNWQPTAKDFLQVSGVVPGKRLLPQGRVSTSGVINLGYRRQLESGTFAVLTISDALNSFRSTTVFDTPALRDRRTIEVNGRAVMIGVTRDFGGVPKKPREPAFDFGGPPAS
jgi:outer membrane receptor protein involved in Fe transport